MSTQLTAQIVAQTVEQTEDITGFNLSLDTVRTFFHLLGVTVWIGGQIVVGFLMPLLRKFGVHVPQNVAQRFNKIAWPFFGLVVFTGIWGLGELKWAEHTGGWKLAFFIKMGVVAGTGCLAYFHTKADKKMKRALFAGGALLTALGAMMIGLGLQG